MLLKLFSLKLFSRFVIRRLGISVWVSMPRHPRLRVIDLPVHIVQRGNNRQPCFFAKADYLFYLNRLAAFVARFQCELHAYVLMTNHVHLLLTPRIGTGISLLMKFLDQSYAQYVNYTYKRSGTLWEGRFRSSVVQSQHYLLACYRYIEMNPVRASIVKHPGDYRWSSYAANTGDRSAIQLTPHLEYLGLSADEDRRRVVYRELFATELDRELLREIRASTLSGCPLGSDGARGGIEEHTRKNYHATPHKPGWEVAGLMAGS